MDYTDCVKSLGDEGAFRVLQKAKTLEKNGKEIIHFEIGETGFETPAFICEAGKKAIDGGYTHYEPSNGIIELREKIAETSGRLRAVSINPDNVVITPGAKPVMFFSMIACCGPGDEVIYQNPGFPIYESVIRFVGATPVSVPLREKNDFRLNLDELQGLITPKTKMIIINSPHNPTGSVLTYEDLKGIAKIALENDLFVMSDEVYKHIVYDSNHNSILSFDGMPERTILIDGFSKSYSMTGWRIGYGIVPEELAFYLTRLMVNSNSCTAGFTQRAALAVLEEPEDEVVAMVDILRKRREVFVKGLNSIDGIRCPEPKGAFYVFPSIEGCNMTSSEFETFLLEKAGVAALSGTSFGSYGEGYIRFAYGNTTENIERAVEKIEKALEKWRA